MEQIDSLVRSVAGFMALSGLDLAEEDKERIRHFSVNPAKFEEQLRLLVAKHIHEKNLEEKYYEKMGI